MAHCPAHDDARASLSVKEGDDGRTLVNCQAGCSFDDIVAAMSLTRNDFFDNDHGSVVQIGREVARYRYLNPDGSTAYEKIRFEPKTFRCEPAGSSRVPYNLPAVIAAKEVWYVEGEKDADRLNALGLVATTTGGATGWRDEYARYFAGKTVNIIPDNDEPGRKHARTVADGILRGGGSSVVVALPGLREHGDVSDWLDAGGMLGQLIERAKASTRKRPWEPITGSTLLSMPEQEIRWTLDGVLPHRGFSVLSAKPKVGKTTLALQLAVAVARGEPFLGRDTMRGPVLYVACDNQQQPFVVRQLRAMGFENEPVEIVFGVPPTEPLAMLTPFVERLKPVLVVIDTLFKFSRVKDMNDYSAMLAALDPVAAFATDHGAHVLGTVHAKKYNESGDDMDAVLGSIAIPGQVDTMVHMKRTPENVRTIATTQRYGTDMEETILNFDPNTWMADLGTSPWAAAVEAAKIKILAQMREFANVSGGSGGSQKLTRDEIFEAVDVRRTVKLQALKELIGNGVVRSGSGKQGDQFVYSIKTPVSPLEEGVPVVSGVDSDKRAFLLVVPGVPHKGEGSLGTLAGSGSSLYQEPSIFSQDKTLPSQTYENKRLDELARAASDRIRQKTKELAEKHRNDRD